MVDSEIIRLFVFISLPFLIDKGREYMRTREQNRNNSERPKSIFDILIVYLLIFTILIQVYYAIWSPPPNIFISSNISPTMSPSVIRTILLTKNSKLTPIDNLLLEKFSSLENRLIYAAYGQEALLDCNYCKNVTDYSMFIIPNVAWSYVMMLMVLGISTMARRKSHWRIYGVIFLIGCGFFELYTLLSTDVIKNSAHGITEFLYNNTDYYRRMAFAVLSFTIFFINKADNKSDMDIIQEIKRNQEIIIHCSKAANLQRTAVLRDNNLRKIFEEFYRRRETEENVVVTDQSYKDARNKTLSKLNMVGLLKEAQTYVSSITGLKEVEIDNELVTGMQGSAAARTAYTSSSNNN
ncbi:2523_t:CDS:1 [Scutellospora calospora]|uniref:2523_t:CDS:1 n=1 Tax=Scutellospora calospora TaxID=85575 RepID=A0ACA9KCL1_9GLOM|nr:2523_t:CDS:1 [Scutellospora calospora]